MMKNKKFLFACVGALAIIAIAVVLLVVFTGGEDTYRSIKVFEIDGSCRVERAGDSLDAFKDMTLSSGDSFTVGEGSFARLKLDDDKFVYLEANTRINLTATGTEKDSKTMVYIERGSMLTEVKRKLSATSSYDIVTPNTTMSIRGTKTLTEVYEDVLGAIKTSAAVVEGHVSFSTIQKDSTGKAVIVSTDLKEGQGLGVTTDNKDLLSQEDVRHIADDGKTADGLVAEETTHEELGTILETPEFSEEFLTNIVEVLARSREEDVEEGFTSGDITEEELNAAINVLNDVIDGKVELPSAVEEYVANGAQTYYDEPIVNDTPVTSDGNDAGSLTQTAGTFGENAGETDIAVNGDESLVSYELGDDAEDDPEENADDAEDADGEGEQSEDGEENPDAADDEKTEEGESEEERIAREEKERLEKEEAERLEKEEQEKKEKEEKERLEKEEQEKKEKEEREKAEKEAAEKEAREQAEREAAEQAEREAREQAAREAAEQAAREAEEQAAREAAEQAAREAEEQAAREAAEQAAREAEEQAAREAAEQAAREAEEQAAREAAEQAAQEAAEQGSGSGTGSGAVSETSTVSYSDSHWEFSFGSQDEATGVAQEIVWTVTPVYHDSSNIVVAYSNLPTTVGALLPGVQGSSYSVTLDVQGDVPEGKEYEFTGWYRSSEAANQSLESARVTTVPNEEVTLYPGIREKEYKIRFVNMFPEAGRIVVPGQDYWSGLTYTSDTDPESEWVEITGLHYGDTIYLPMTSDILTYENTEVASRLHIETNFTETALGLTEYAGIGIGTKGSDGVVRGGDDVNLARILLGDTDYEALRQNDFVRYSTANDSVYRIPTEIRSDMTFYLYFSTKVKLTVPHGEESTPVRMLDADGTGEIKTVLERYGFNFILENSRAHVFRITNRARWIMYNNNQSSSFVEEHATGTRLKLRSGTDDVRDQYWGVHLHYTDYESDNNVKDIVYIFETYYFGKPLDIPSFAVAESRESLYDLSAKLLLYGEEPLVTGGHVEQTYVNTPASGNINAMTISRTGTSSSWLFRSENGVTKLNYNTFGFELDEYKFVTLDLSESGISENIGSCSQNLIRKHGDTDSRSFRLRVIKKPISYGNLYYNAALIPEDAVFDWSAGGSERTSELSDESFAISKAGMRLAGFSIICDNPENQSTQTDTVYLNSEEASNQWIDYIDGEYVLKLGEQTENKAYTIKPIFIPDGPPFTINLVRPEAATVRPYDAQANWAMYTYYLEISGLDKYANAGRAITEIDLTSLVAKCYTSASGAPEGYYGVHLDAVLKLEQKEGDTRKKYYLYNENDEPSIISDVHQSFVPLDGRISIPLEPLGQFTNLSGFEGVYYDVQFIWGIDYDVNPGNPYGHYVSFKTEATGPLDCGTGPSSVSQTFSTYKPYKYYIDPGNAAFAYTAVYTSDAGTEAAVPQLVFSEFMDSSIASGYLLGALTGINISNAWYGGVIRDKGRYGTSIESIRLEDYIPWVVTRDASAEGRPEVVIKGGDSSIAGSYGSGVLWFDTFKYLYIEPNKNGNSPDTIKVYGSLSYDSETGKVTHGELSETLQQFYGSGNTLPSQLYLELNYNPPYCPDGWAKVKRNGESGYIYFGSDNIEGKAVAGFILDDVPEELPSTY